MIKLLQFIVKYLAELFETYRFSIISSNNSGNDFHGASVLMASDEIEIFLAIERLEITAQFRSVLDNRKNNWYSAEIVLALVGHQNCLGVLDDNTGSYIKNDLSTIIGLFQKSKIEQTLKGLDAIKRVW